MEFLTLLSFLMCAAAAAAILFLFLLKPTVAANTGGCSDKTQDSNPKNDKKKNRKKKKKKNRQQKKKKLSSGSKMSEFEDSDERPDEDVARRVSLKPRESTSHESPRVEKKGQTKTKIGHSRAVISVPDKTTSKFDTSSSDSAEKQSRRPARRSSPKCLAAKDVTQSSSVSRSSPKAQATMKASPTAARNESMYKSAPVASGIYMHGGSALEESHGCAADDDCVVFIDNSNIFIEAQKYYARHLKLKVRQDPRCRIDIGNLLDLAVDGRTMRCGKLYGSEPPAQDIVWRKIREKGLDVEVFKKNFKGKEKEVDTAMTADAVRYAFESKARKHTVIIIAGDRDYCPLVKTLLDVKREWTIELVAFQHSISPQMKTIRKENFEIKTLESLLQESMNQCCFIEARWRTELYQIPKNKTIILFFKEPLISPKANFAEQMRANKLLKQYAEEITQITGIPCCYHLCNWEPNTGRLVYIVGRNWDKNESGCGRIDFFRICRENDHPLSTRCSEICKLYEKYSTMMESEATVDALELENRFIGLDVEEAEEFSDDEILSQIYDDDNIAIKAEEGLDEANTESDSEPSGEDSNPEGFTEVKSSSEVRKSRRKYSEYCQYEFSCFRGQKCEYTHTKKQENFFKANGGKGRRGYKSKPCQLFHIKGDCKAGNSKAPNCAYYHSKEEARCYVCKNSDLEYVGHASHDHEEQ